MKNLTVVLFLCSVLALAASGMGCSKTDAKPTPLAADKIPAAVNEAFNKASDDTKQAASTYVADLQGQDPTAAFLQLQKMSAMNNLTPEQRDVLVKARQTTFKQLQDAAQNGNASAQTVMHQYLSTR